MGQASSSLDEQVENLKQCLLNDDSIDEAFVALEELTLSLLEAESEDDAVAILTSCGGQRMGNGSFRPWPNQQVSLMDIEKYGHVKKDSGCDLMLIMCKHANAELRDKAFNAMILFLNHGETHQLFISAGLLHQATTDALGSDLALKSNALQILACLTRSAFGKQKLIQKNTVDVLISAVFSESKVITVNAAEALAAICADDAIVQSDLVSRGCLAPLKVMITSTDNAIKQSAFGLVSKLCEMPANDGAIEKEGLVHLAITNIPVCSAALHTVCMLSMRARFQRLIPALGGLELLLEASNSETTKVSRVAQLTLLNLASLPENQQTVINKHGLDSLTELIGDPDILLRRQVVNCMYRIVSNAIYQNNAFGVQFGTHKCLPILIQSASDPDMEVACQALAGLAVLCLDKEARLLLSGAASVAMLVDIMLGNNSFNLANQEMQIRVRSEATRCLSALCLHSDYLQTAGAFEQQHRNHSAPDSPDNFVASAASQDILKLCSWGLDVKNMLPSQNRNDTQAPLEIGDPVFNPAVEFERQILLLLANLVDLPGRFWKNNSRHSATQVRVFQAPDVCFFSLIEMLDFDDKCTSADDVAKVLSGLANMILTSDDGHRWGRAFLDRNAGRHLCTLLKHDCSVVKREAGRLVHAICKSEDKETVWSSSQLNGEDDAPSKAPRDKLRQILVEGGIIRLLVDAVGLGFVDTDCEVLAALFAIAEDIVTLSHHVRHGVVDMCVTVLSSEKESSSTWLLAAKLFVQISSVPKADFVNGVDCGPAAT